MGKHYPSIQMFLTANWKNIVLQLHVIFKIFCLCNYTYLLHIICVNNLYRHKILCNLILVKIVTNELLFSLPALLLCFQQLTKYFKMSPGSGSYFSLILVKWSKYTHIKAILTSLFSFIKPLL
jgi:hypothetical protein